MHECMSEMDRICRNLLSTDAISRSQGKWLECIEVVGCVARIPHEAFGDKLVWVGEVSRGSKGGPVVDCDGGLVWFGGLGVLMW